MDSEINFKSDFLTFKDQIVEKFGEQYFDQADLFFERAIVQANQGFLHNAAADGKFALELVDYSNGSKGIQYLLGFLSQLHCDLGQISKSKAYYKLGIKFLDPKDEGDIQLFKELEEHIDNESLEGGTEENSDE